ncbi:MAG: ABC transporter ATP-binding protein [Desulfomonile tiedjei]|uniref:ABC transporter ATP-binding protein n=1 Tax=Desulfomonile tiedjei TaxID=2358 RepID=A0A9D6Z1Q9_9BACT|nr:ABC transporter ATP-binding protein [Desulfomonile tiedjei]
MLEVEKINTYYDTSHVLQNVSLKVAAGQSVALLGRNGAGKTTTLRSIMGLTPAKTGSINFEGKQIRGMQPYEIAKSGVSYMPDDLRVFVDLTCEENLEIARRVCKRSGHWTREKVEELFPVLADRRKQKGLSFSGGEKKMLSLGRALMMNPSLVLLDEPSEGLAPLVVRKLIETIGEIRRRGLTLLLADQNLKFCRQVCEYGYILEKGTVVHEGSMEAIWANDEVVKRYLAV